MDDLLARGWWTLALRGAVAILFGVAAWVWPGITVVALVLLFAWPASGALAVVWLIGFFSVLFGAALVGAALRLRRLARELAEPGMRPGGASPTHP